MTSRVFSVKYEINAQNWRDGQFSIPVDVANILALQDEDQLSLEVCSHKGVKTFITTMKSGKEIYGLSEHVDAGELVVVSVTKIDAFK